MGGLGIAEALVGCPCRSLFDASLREVSVGLLTLVLSLSALPA